MDSVIIYPNNKGGLAFCFPCDCGLSVEEIARKDVPAGKPYLIVPADQVPKDTAFMDAMQADFSQPHGYGIGAAAWFEEKSKEAA